MTPRKLPCSDKGGGTDWPFWTLAMLILGYGGYYFCRSQFSVAKPLILHDLKGAGVTKETLGVIAAWGTLCYAVGKLVCGMLADSLGGRRMFLAGMAGSILFTLLFALGGPSFFLVAWIGNRSVQSAGWVGLVKVTSKWFRQDTYGRIMGFASLSYLFGDFVSRLFLSELVALKVGWREIFIASAGVLALIAIPTWIIVRENPACRGLVEPPKPTVEALDGMGEPEMHPGWSRVLLPLVTNRTFWTVCFLSFGFTFIRETFSDWTPTYLTEVTGMRADEAGRASALFPFFGGIGVIATGFLSDKLGRAGGALLLASGLAIGTAGLGFLSTSLPNGHANLAIAVVAGIAFVQIGPYSLLSGAISLRLGGKHGGATAAGWIDGLGYFGGILSGNLIGSIAERNGWEGAFRLLAITSLISCFVALYYWSQVRNRIVTLTTS